MSKRDARVGIETATGRMRDLVRAKAEGELIGSEEDLIVEIGCSRSTIRQVARVLEREGLLTVRRGKKGGYFGARPDVGTIEEMFATYLDLIEIDRDDVTIMASALWVEAIRKAARRPLEEIESAVLPIKDKIGALNGGEPFEEIRVLELSFQQAIFDLSNSAYIKLIFEINMVYARRAFFNSIIGDATTDHVDFVHTWREAKLLEIGALLQRDAELAGIAGKYSRKIWHARILSRFPLPQ